LHSSSLPFLTQASTENTMALEIPCFRALRSLKLTFGLNDRLEPRSLPPWFCAVVEDLLTAMPLLESVELTVRIFHDHFCMAILDIPWDAGQAITYTKRHPRLLQCHFQLHIYNAPHRTRDLIPALSTFYQHEVWRFLWRNCGERRDNIQYLRRQRGKGIDDECAGWN
jgi:hypothetical protein